MPADLSAKQVATLGIGRHRVAPNLYLVVAQKASGTVSRAWVMIYRSPKSGLRAEMGLGPVELVSVPRAKGLALQHRMAIGEGRCPLEEKRAAQSDRRRVRVLTFGQVADLYIESHRAGWRSQRHGEEFAASLERHALPLLGKVSVDEIGTAEVMQVLEPIWSRSPVTASRVRGRIELILDFARTRQWRSGENPARWKGHLENLLPHHRKVKAVKHFAALDWRDLPEFWTEIGDDLPALALRFAILTCARPGEVRGARWSEIDLGAALWTIPGERMKKGREHRVPLSRAALAILDKLAEMRQGEFLFPGVRVGQPIGRTAMLECLGKLRPGVTVHGFRSAFRDWASEQQISSEVAEAALAHAVTDQVEAAYRRGDLLEPRRPVGERWAQFLIEPKVVRLRA
jgi:integrase